MFVISFERSESTKKNQTSSKRIVIYSEFFAYKIAGYVSILITFVTIFKNIKTN